MPIKYIRRRFKLRKGETYYEGLKRKQINPVDVCKYNKLTGWITYVDVSVNNLNALDRLDAALTAVDDKNPDAKAD